MNDNHKVIIIGCHASAFHLRNDLKMKTLLAAKDVVEYAGKGTKLMVKKGWMEKPLELRLKQ